MTPYRLTPKERANLIARGVIIPPAPPAVSLPQGKRGHKATANYQSPNIPVRTHAQRWAWRDQNRCELCGEPAHFYNAHDGYAVKCRAHLDRDNERRRLRREGK